MGSPHLYRWGRMSHFDFLHLAIHTFAGYKGTDGLLYCINQYRDDTKLSNDNDIDAVTNHSDHIFRVGYILI